MKKIAFKIIFSVVITESKTKFITHFTEYPGRHYRDAVKQFASHFGWKDKTQTKEKKKPKLFFLLPNKENEQEAVEELSFMAHCI